MAVLKKQFGKSTVYASTEEAKKKLNSGWQPCSKKTGCACGAKTAAKADLKKDEPGKNFQGA